VSDLCGGTIDHLDLSAAKGEVVGLTGLIGSGYDEIPYLLYGARHATGTLRLVDDIIDLAGFSPRQAMRHAVVLIPGDRPNAGAIGVLPVTDNVTMPILDTGFRRFMLDRGGMVRIAQELSQRFEVRPPNPILAMSALSGGNQQKVLLARCMALNPKVLIVDEPTRGIDVGAKAEVHQLLCEMAARGVAVIVISSELPEVMALSDRIVVFREGRVNGVVSSQDASEAALMELMAVGHPAMPRSPPTM
jgi:ABC-type sugar transport system ATPase subunit